MPKTKHSAFAIRPRSIFAAWGKTWRVLSNDTLAQRLTLIELDAARPERKTVHYQGTTEIVCRWVPFSYR